MLTEDPFAERLLRWTQIRAHQAMILAHGRRALDGETLYQTIQSTRGLLVSWGIKPRHRIVSSLAHGADASLAALAIACHCSYVPLNPDQNRDEWVHAVRAIRPAGLLIRAGQDSLAVSVAREYGVPLMTWETGQLLLEEARPLPAENAVPGEHFLLQTSGTVKPKYVPRTSIQICAAVDQWCGAIPLTPEDRCIVIAPAFLALGLFGSILLTALTGGSLLHPGGEGPLGVFEACEHGAPSWLAASPAGLLQLTQLARRHGICLSRPLRFIRTAGSALDPELATAAKRLFGARVLSSYGSTEAPHISTLRFDDPEHATHAGRACPGVSIRIDAEEGLPASAGEIVVSAEGFSKAYWDDSEATREAFERDSTGRCWYRTGDIGRLDFDGNLNLIGRKTDIINRGGLKIGPWELEAVLLEHPAVAEAAAFKIPDDRLGEEAAVAVTLQGVEKPSAADLRGFAGRNLSLAKTPRHVFVLEEIPRNKMGKPLRGRLAEICAKPQLERAPKVRPRDQLEEDLLRICEKILGVRGVSMTDNFFDLGGDSLSALEYLFRVSKKYSLDDLLDTSLLFESDSFFLLADLLRQACGVESDASPHGLIALRSGSDRAGVPLVVIGQGGFGLGWTPLVRYLPLQQAVYLLKLPPIDRTAGVTHFRDIARLLVASLQEALPYGPYALAGRCVMGALAQEMAVQLEDIREQVPLVLALDCFFPFADRSIVLRPQSLLRRARRVWQEEGNLRRFLRRGRSFIRVVETKFSVIGLGRYVRQNQFDRDVRTAQAACRSHLVVPIAGRLITIFSRDPKQVTGKTPEELWGGATKHGLIVERVVRTGSALAAESYHRELAGIVERHLREVTPSDPSALS